MSYFNFSKNGKLLFWYQSLDSFVLFADSQYPFLPLFWLADFLNSSTLNFGVNSPWWFEQQPP